MKNTRSILAAAGLLIAPILCNAAPVSFGALSSNDDGSTHIITDSLNNREWLRWDVLGSLSYQDTLAAISSGGQFAGWVIANNSEAQKFTNALLLGLSNACTVTGADTCNSTLPNNLTDLLGDTALALTEEVAFLSDGEGGVGYMQYVHEGAFGTFNKSNDWGNPEAFGWLLYRGDGSVPPPTSVPEPATFALFGIGLAGLGVLRRRRSAA